MDDATKSRIASNIQGFNFVLHDLCVNKDWGETRSCLKVFDQTAKMPKDGDLPIHVALANSCPQEIAEALIAAYPPGAHTPSARNQYPLLLAMASSPPYSTSFLTTLITPDTAKGLSTLGETALIAAISKCLPSSFICTLLNAYPEAIKIPDDMDNLPLHEAVEKGDEDVIKILYEQYPEAAEIENGMGDIVDGFWAK